jgi:hypothetical protein
VGRHKQLAQITLAWAVLTGVGTALAGHVLWGQSLSLTGVAVSVVIFALVGAPMWGWALRRSAQRPSGRA